MNKKRSLSFLICLLITITIVLSFVFMTNQKKNIHNKEKEQDTRTIIRLADHQKEFSDPLEIFINPNTTKEIQDIKNIMKYKVISRFNNVEIKNLLEDTKQTSYDYEFTKWIDDKLPQGALLTISRKVLGSSDFLKVDFKFSYKESINLNLYHDLFQEKISNSIFYLENNYLKNINKGELLSWICRQVGCISEKFKEWFNNLYSEWRKELIHLDIQDESANNLNLINVSIKIVNSNYFQRDSKLNLKIYTEFKKNFKMWDIPDFQEKLLDDNIEKHEMYFQTTDIFSVDGYMPYIIDNKLYFKSKEYILGDPGFYKIVHQNDKELFITKKYDSGIASFIGFSLVFNTEAKTILPAQKTSYFNQIQTELKKFSWLSGIYGCRKINVLSGIGTNGYVFSKNRNYFFISNNYKSNYVIGVITEKQNLLISEFHLPQNLNFNSCDSIVFDNYNNSVIFRSIYNHSTLNHNISIYTLVNINSLKITVSKTYQIPLINIFNIAKDKIKKTISGKYMVVINSLDSYFDWILEFDNSIKELSIPKKTEDNVYYNSYINFSKLYRMEIRCRKMNEEKIEFQYTLYQSNLNNINQYRTIWKTEKINWIITIKGSINEKLVMSFANDDELGNNIFDPKYKYYYLD